MFVSRYLVAEILPSPAHVEHSPPAPKNAQGQHPTEEHPGEHPPVAPILLRSLDRRIKKAQFPQDMRFDTFDLNFQPGLNVAVGLRYE